MIRFIPLLWWAAACHQAPQSAADVKLQIDGQSYDFSSTHVEWEQPGGEPISVYLLPEDTQSGQPYLNLRYYSGNPVGHVWLRYTTDVARFDHPPKWECFIPGTLRDGTQTLTWKNPDGSDRHANETGQEGCVMTVEDQGQGRLHVEFDLVLRPKQKDMKTNSEDGSEVLLHATGSADIRPL